MSIPVVSAKQLKERLEPLLEAHPNGAVVFDADGTLWSHDVGCMVFDAAVEQAAFREEALEPLVRAALEFGLTIQETSANSVARRLQEAWYGGRTGERATAEMQVWAYVGFSESEFRALVRGALRAGGHESTLHEEVLDLAHWVRDSGRRSCIVSASPLWVVQEATRDLGFSEADVTAGIPNTRAADGRSTIAPGMAQPLPYGPDKVVAGRSLLGDSEWIAALGDSSFDLEMMRAARVGVGIGNKSKMLEGLAELANGVLLRLTG